MLAIFLTGDNRGSQPNGAYAWLPRALRTTVSLCSLSYLTAVDNVKPGPWPGAACHGVCMGTWAMR